MSKVLYQRDGRIARITLNRPETLANANASALAQNDYSFIDAEHSATRHAMAPAMPLGCLC
jgi:hypothetical protein